jgi:S-adenosylmethionine synthetase
MIKLTYKTIDLLDLVIGMDFKITSPPPLSDEISDKIIRVVLKTLAGICNRVDIISSKGCIHIAGKFKSASFYSYHKSARKRIVNIIKLKLRGIHD